MYPANPTEGAFIQDEGSFLGTGFFIMKNGIALTAAHCLPSPDDLNEKSVCAGIWDGKNIRAHKILSFLKFPGLDIAVMDVDNIAPKYLEVAFSQLYMGMDVETVGIPLSSITPEGIGVRTIKGYVTFVGKIVEVSFPAPRGLSGSPVFYKGKVVGIVSANTRSEYLEDQVKEVIKISDEKEETKIVETKAIENYGRIQLLLPLQKMHHEMFKRDSFEEMIRRVNG